jgi:hypothetical protein
MLLAQQFDSSLGSTNNSLDNTSSKTLQENTQFNLQETREQEEQNSSQRTTQYQHRSDTMKRAGRTEHKLKQHREITEKGNVYTTQLKLRQCRMGSIDMNL